MSGDFPNVTILGGGLLGGSLALALPLSKNPPSVRLWVRREETVQEAKAAGIDGVTANLAGAVKDADLVVLAVPVGAMPALLEAAIQAGLPTGALVTDVGSVKGHPHETLRPVLSGTGIGFIGSHPMAGSERNGISAANAGLFQGAACLLTNDDHVAGSKAAALDHFWQSVGCHTAWMSAVIHDALVARISHLPHLIAASGARVSLKDPAEGRFGGGGLRDTTRVAGGNPDMWAEIVMENREAILGPLRETVADLSEILASLESGDQESVREWLTVAKQRRDSYQQPLAES
jgi:prephenate dehydrogenase